MHTIEVNNVNEALSEGIYHLLAHGEREESRVGQVIVAPTPVMTIYKNPCHRVLFSETRDANPFFHLMESLWMLAGRADLEFPLYFNSRFKEFSDDGRVVHGAYGARWRRWFGFDQLEVLLTELAQNPKSRRAVLQMWSPVGDLVGLEMTTHTGEYKQVGGLTSKDVPCNTTAYFDLRHDQLNMTVLNRSNDVIWGAYGANAVHFSILQEYIASVLNVPVGVYRQFSNNYHIYTDRFSEEVLEEIALECTFSNHYKKGVKNFPLMSTPVQDWHRDLQTFMRGNPNRETFNDPFFSTVAVPMYNAWQWRKEKLGTGLQHIENIAAEDWKLAATQWVARRERKH